MKKSKGFGNKPLSKVRTKVTISDLTGKYLLMASVNGGKWFCVSPHFKQEDALAAIPQVEQVFSQFSPAEWKDNACLHKACLLLTYEDDDEPLGLIRENLVDTTSHTMGNIRAIWAEQGLLSDAVLQERKAKSHPFMQ